MTHNHWKQKVEAFDERRDIVIPGNHEETLEYCVEQFFSIAEASIKQRGCFTVALSGGSTPKAIYQRLTSPENSQRIDWHKVMLFWSDERCVPPAHPESNYHMAMEAGFASLMIPEKNIFRMKGEMNPEESAKEYEKMILSKVPDGVFDMVMLGMGEDGHTASLFPHTHGLRAENRLAIGNYVPQKETWRLTLTFQCINSARHIVIYVLGKGKAPTIKKIFTSPYAPDEIPIQKIGVPTHKALWILDRESLGDLLVK